MKSVLGAIGILVGLGLAAPALACTQEEALNMMLKLAPEIGNQAAKATTQEETEKYVAANNRVNEGGVALGNGDYDTACKIYQEVADQFGISLK